MKFSVVIITKDRIDFLIRCINSVVNSSLLPEQVVIVNDSLDPLNLNLKNLPFELNVIDNGQSFGANYCRNIGVEKAEHEIVFMLDDDDSVTLDSFSSRILLFNNNKDLGLVFTGANVVLSTDLDTTTKTILPKDRLDYYFSLLCEGNVVGSTSRVGFTKSAFYKAGKFDEVLKCRQDYDLWIRIAKIAKVAHDNSIGINYTVHTDNKNQITKNYRKFLFASEYLYNKYNKDIKGKKLSKKFKSNSYYRVSQIASKESNRIRIKYAFISFILSPSFKSLILVCIPNYFITKFRLFT